MSTIHIAIIDDDRIIRESIAKYLNEIPNYECKLICDSLNDFLKKTEYFPNLDIVLSDIGMPDIDGIEGISLIKKRYKNVGIIMLSVYDDNRKIFNALCAGAVGYLQKSIPLSQIRDAIDVVANGGSAMSPAIARKVVEYFAPRKREHETLTKKEQQVVNGLVEGLSYKLIADRMSVGLETVREHIKNVYRKLQVNSKAEVIAKSYKGEI